MCGGGAREGEEDGGTLPRKHDTPFLFCTCAQIINFYFNLIAERSSSTMSVHVMSSFFYPKLAQAGYSGVSRWTKKVG